MGALFRNLGVEQDGQVASIAESQGVKGKAIKAPITAHPAFPFIVALWFAALLGMGSLVVPVEAIERLTVATGIASLVPATAPQLGVTARALIALAFTGTGALAGLMIARQVAKAQQPEFARSYPPAMPYGPIQAHAELGAHGFDGQRPAVQPKGRRSLAIELDHGPSDLLDFAPLPGNRVERGNSSLEMLDPDARQLVPRAWSQGQFDDDALELTEADLVASNNIEGSLSDTLIPASAKKAEGATLAFQTIGDESGDAKMHDMMGNRPPFSSQFASAKSDDPASTCEVDAAPPAIVAAQAVSEASDLQFASADEPLSAPLPARARVDAHKVGAGSTLLSNEPTLVELSKRLGDSIERRRKMLAERAQHAAGLVALVPSSEDLEVAAPIEAAAATAAYFASPAKSEISAKLAVPPVAQEPLTEVRQVFQPPVEEALAQPSISYGDLCRLQSVNFDEEEDAASEAMHDLAASFTLPLSTLPVTDLAVAEASFDTLGIEPDAAPAIQSRNPSHGQQPQVCVRIEDEPETHDMIGERAVEFPSEEAPKQDPAHDGIAAVSTPPRSEEPRALVNSAENERALREALFSLQRMSGAA